MYLKYDACASKTNDSTDRNDPGPVNGTKPLKHKKPKAEEEDLVSGLEAGVSGADDKERNEELVDSPEKKKMKRRPSKAISCLPAPNGKLKGVTDHENHGCHRLKGPSYSIE